LRSFLWAWATPFTIGLTLLGLIIGFTTFELQQAANQAQVLDQQHQNILDTYLDRMSDLLLTYHLAASKPGDVVRAVAQARTYLALQNLDGNRKGTLIEFLWDASLIFTQQPIISLDAAHLDGTWLSETDLKGADLSYANLTNALYLTQQQLDQVASCKGAILLPGLTCHNNR
jgi:hypothetical protein